MSLNQAKVTLDLFGGGCSIQNARAIQPLGSAASVFGRQFRAFCCCARLDNSFMIRKSYDVQKKVLKSRVIRLPHTAAFVVLSTQLELRTKNKPALKVGGQGPQIARRLSFRFP